jgi:DNA-binding FadR family transcriptional regulator
MSSFPAFSPIERERPLSEGIAERMLHAIVTNEFEPGQVLPSTTTLAMQFRVSRTVIREALRTLIAKDLVRVEGRRMIVERVRPSTVCDSMSLFLRGRSSLNYERIHEVRESFEIAIAGLAADRATTEDHDRLRSVFEQLPSALASGDVEAAATADVSFHRVLAELTRNDLFPLLLDAMGEVMFEARLASLVLPQRGESAVEEHRRVLHAVQTGRPDAARSAMRDHLAESKASWAGRGMDAAPAGGRA